MLDLPAPVVNYLHTLTVNNCSPAYLFVTKDGCLSKWGGKLAAYGIQALQPGEYVGKQVCFLEGLLPLDDSPIFLPRIKAEYGICADLHIFPGDEGDWVLLLDATWEENQSSLIQQKGNDLSLLRYEHSRILNQYFGKDVTENLAQKLLSLQVKGERRDVTILRANICGFAAQSENHPADVVFSTLNFYISTMIQPIVDAGGMVDKLAGDVVMGFFGVLPSAASPSNQAIKAALQMVEAVKDIAKVQRADNFSAFDIGIGITSGSVALGIIGNKDRRTLGAIGYPVNLAVNLAQQALKSEILIDENTFNKLDSMQEYFSATNLGKRAIAEPIRTYSYLFQ